MNHGMGGSDANHLLMDDGNGTLYKGWLWYLLAGDIELGVGEGIALPNVLLENANRENREGSEDYVVQ